MRVEKRFASRGRPCFTASVVALVCALATLATAMPLAAATLDRIRESNRLRLGYIAAAAPFSFRGKSGEVEGYSAVLCDKVAAEVKKQLSMPALQVDWTPVSVAFDNRLSDLAKGKVDLMCSPAVATFGRREVMSFSVPIFPGGVRAVVRPDASAELRQALGDNPTQRPVWRGSPATKVLTKTSFTVVGGTTTQGLLMRRLEELQINAKINVVPDYRTGLQQLLDRKTDVFFGDRALVLSTLGRASPDKIVILDRLLTHEPYALALERNDDDFRLIVDRALSRFYASPEFADVYRSWFGEFDDNTRRFFVWTTPSE